MEAFYRFGLISTPNADFITRYDIEKIADFLVLAEQLKELNKKNFTNDLRECF